MGGVAAWCAAVGGVVAMAEIVQVAVSFAHQSGIPALFTLAVIAGESVFSPFAVNGPNLGLIQVNSAVWGGDINYWGGISGLWRSLLLMQDRWLSVVTPGWESSFGTQWAAAQGADPWACVEKGPQALALARSVWQDYIGGP